MAQTKEVKAVKWNEFFDGKVIDKDPTIKKLIGYGTKTAAVAIVALAIGQIAMPHMVGAAAVPVMAAAPDFQTALHSAMQPIHNLIKGFAHEIYAVFMAWGAIETMIGKTQQGFTRMKTATLGYVLLYWVPLIVDLVNNARPG